MEESGLDSGSGLSIVFWLLSGERRLHGDDWSLMLSDSGLANIICSWFGHFGQINSAKSYREQRCFFGTYSISAVYYSYSRQISLLFLLSSSTLTQTGNNSKYSYYTQLKQNKECWIWKKNYHKCQNKTWWMDLLKRDLKVSSIYLCSSSGATVQNCFISVMVFRQFLFLVPYRKISPGYLTDFIVSHVQGSTFFKSKFN